MRNSIGRREFIKDTGGLFGGILASSGFERARRKLDTNEEREEIEVRGTIMRDGEMFDQDTFVLLKSEYEDLETGMLTHPVSMTPEYLREELRTNIDSNYEFRMRKSDWHNLASVDYQNNSKLPEYSQTMEEWWSTSE